MTFDEALRDYRFRSSIGPIVQGIKLSPFVNVPQQEYDQVKFLNNLFYATINKLRKEYEPMVEMTEMQMKQMMSFKEVNAGFSTFMYKQGLGQLPAFSDFITTQRENELMQAWLRPETIKVVDE